MRKRPKRKFYRLNYNILAPQLRVIDEKGKQVGIFPKEKALQLAREKKIDLVEVVPQASPPICKLIDFKKFLYLEKKKQKGQKKSKGGGVKKIRLRPFIGEHDYQVKLGQIKDFLKEDEKVRISINFFGREIVKKKFGFEIIDRLLKDLGERATLEREPRFLGKTLVAQVTTEKNHGQKKERKEAKSQNQKGS